MMTIFKKNDYCAPPLNLEIYADIGPRKKVLDVGCGPGKLGAALKEKDCFRVGIEIDRELAQAAKANYDDLIIEDLENLTGLSYPAGYFDVIVFADILEHLSNPERLLFVLREYLAPDGYILACIPNVANWQVRLNLFLGRFDYGPGILDGGHLRFFTGKSARVLLEGSGYRIVWIKSRNRLVKILGRMNKKLFAFQFMIKAVRS